MTTVQEDRVRVTLLSRNTSYRRILNQNEVCIELHAHLHVSFVTILARNLQWIRVKLAVSYNRHMEGRVRVMPHSRQIPNRCFYLTDCNFLTRMLFADSYRWCFSFSFMFVLCMYNVNF